MLIYLDPNNASNKPVEQHKNKNLTKYLLQLLRQMLGCFKQSEEMNLYELMSMGLGFCKITKR